MRTENKNLLNYLILIVLISLIIGSLAGGFSGFYISKRIYSNQRLIKEINSENYSLSEEDKEDKNIFFPIGNEEKIIKAVEKINPSVVNIIISKDVSVYPQDSSFNDFFNQFFSYPDLDYPGVRIPTPVPNPPQPEEKEKQEVGSGTGFIISSQEGLILTNKHVVDDENAEYTVITNQGDSYEAQVLARDPFNDIAILKINQEDFNLPEVDLGDSDQIKIGQTVIAIGNALGEYRNTVTKGVISGISRRIVAGSSFGQSEVLENVIQTDAAINFGNSGGPLIDINGKVIGINTAINQGGQLIGFAIPINQAKQVIESVKEYGRIVRPFLGIRYLILNVEIAQKNNLPYDYGVLIIRGEQATDLAIIPGSPANKAGLAENDIILEIEGKKIDQENSLAKEIQKFQPNEEIELKIYHQGEEKNIKVILEEYQSK